MERVRPAQFASLSALFGHLHSSQPGFRPLEVDYRRSHLQGGNPAPKAARALEASYAQGIFGHLPPGLLDGLR